MTLETDRPYPVTAQRLHQVATHAGLNSRREGDSVIFTHSHLAYTRARLSDEDPGFIHFRLSLQHTLEFADLPSLTAFINDWNHNCLSPMMTINLDNPDAISVSGSVSVLARHGLSDEQLGTIITSAIETAESVLTELTTTFPQLRQDHEPVHYLVPEAVSTPAPTSPVPSPLTLQRLYAVLPQLGIRTFQRVPEAGALAWVNEVLMGFFIDNGPSLVVKGHWDPGLEEKEFTKLFLICNDWNRKNGSAAAFCHSNPDGLQLRIDYTTPVAEGMTDKQLVGHLTIAMKEILHGIDDIAQDCIGTSPVVWP